MGLARNIVGIIGNVISFGLFLSPVPTFYRIYKKKAVEEFQAIPYLVTVMNCILWCFYGLPFVKKDNFLVLTINAIGLVIELTYLTIYVIYANDRKKRLTVAYVLLGEVASTVVIVLVAMLALHGSHRTLFVGVMSDIFNIFMYASPLAIWKKVITTKSVEYMPFWLSLAGFSNGVCWTIYGLLPPDIFILISNGLGAIFGFAQLALYGYYYFNGKDSKKEKRQAAEVQLSNQPGGMA
ncbi:bidirectional sugar transporter SWEET7-like [Hibiscus syriacus]|uniref:bidirectional sugar transporter SWEET7-like n=1 Tax=Hibiscus syriacus TaxID=106335 RepID=UPI00192296DB|nr:bidirectional sugar transporter SWEET7-like [Hibiscus syriacus]